MNILCNIDDTRIVDSSNATHGATCVNNSQINMIPFELGKWFVIIGY